MEHADAIKVRDVPPQKTVAALDDAWGNLMGMAQEGNSGAYHRLLGQISIWLQRYYSRRIPSEQIDDLVQETLVAVHQRRHTYEMDRPFRAWLAGIARHKAIDRLRSNGRDRSEPIGDYEPAVADHSSEVGSRIAISDLLARLKPAQARVIRLVKLDGFTIDEAAVATGQSVPLVKVNIHRGISRLAAFLQSADEPARQKGAQTSL